MTAVPAASRALVASATEILADAFRVEPMFAIAFPDAVRRLAALPLVFGALARQALRTGWIDLAERDGRPVGAALWMDGQRSDVGWGAVLRDGHVRVGFAGGIRDALRLMRLQNHISAEHHRLVPGPHYYLAALGVRTECQGQGIGRELLHRGAARADADSLPAYLETHLERNARLYLREGYDLVGEGYHHGLHTRYMVRPVGGSGQH